MLTYNITFIHCTNSQLYHSRASEVASADESDAIYSCISMHFTFVPRFEVQAWLPVTVTLLSSVTIGRRAECQSKSGLLDLHCSLGNDCTFRACRWWCARARPMQGQGQSPANHFDWSSECVANSAKSDFFCRRKTLGLPNSATRPWSRTRIRSLSITVLSRCAIVRTVQSWNRSRITFWMIAS
jgi:hypothetical protein